MTYFFQKIINSFFGANSIFARAASDSMPSFVIQNPLAIEGGLQEILALIINFLTNITFIIAPIMYLWAGFQYLTSAGDDKKIKSAKNTIIWTTVGVLIILMAEGVIYIVQDLLIPQETTIPQDASVPYEEI